MSRTHRCPICRAATSQIAGGWNTPYYAPCPSKDDVEHKAVYQAWREGRVARPMKVGEGHTQ